MNFKKLTILFVIVITAALLTVSITSAQDVAREDTVIFDIDGATIIENPEIFNHMIPGNQRNAGMHQALWEPLFILNYETGAIDPWLGDTFEPNETLDVWTLAIKDGITWQDGEAYNADDIVFTINLLLGDETQTLSDAANMQQWVSSVEKLDDLTVQFNLVAPNPRFKLDYFSVRIWGGVIILPEHVWADKDPFTFTNYDPEQGWPLGTGPYTLTSTSSTEMIWDRFDGYWGTDVFGLPEPLRLIWTVTGAEENKALAMSEAELDSAMDMTLGAFESVLNRNPNVIGWFDGMPYVWFDPCPRQLSINFDVEPWSDSNLRKAISLLIDRDEIVEFAYEGTTIPSRTMFVDYTAMAPFIDAIDGAVGTISPTADVAAGQALIEAAGYALNSSGLYEKDGTVLSMDIQTHEGFIEKRRIAQVLVEQLREAGIDATTRAVAGGTWEDNKAFGNYEGVLDWDACGSINEPWNSMNRFTTQFYRPIGERSPGTNNHVRWNTEGAAAYSAIVQQIGVLPLGDPSIPALVAEAYAIFDAEQVVVPITQARKLVPFDTTYWTGWPTAENNYNHPATWWQSTHQIIHNLERAS